MVIYNSKKSNQVNRFTITKIHTKRKYNKQNYFINITKLSYAR
jgi:hypothetical protein